MKRFFALVVCLMLVLSLVACSAGGESSTPGSGSEIQPPAPSESTPAPEPSSSSSEEPPQEEPPAPESPGEDPASPEPSESPAVEPPVPERPFSGPMVSEDGLILPPQVPHGIALEGIKFSGLDKTGIVSLLEPVMERAQFFCRFGCKGDFDDKLGIEMDYSPEAAIHRPYRIWDEHTYYPCRNLSYQTVEELKQDMCTVFTPDVLEDISYLAYVFDGLTDYDGRIYCVGDVSGYTKERYWELDKMEIVTAGETKLTISAPVSAWGPSGEVFTAQLNFEIKDGYIIMDRSYFATSNS